MLSNPAPLTRRPARLPLFRNAEREIVQLLLRPHHFDACPALNEPETAIDLHEIGLPLGLRVPRHFGDAQRELALLPLLAFLNEGAYTLEQRIVIRGAACCRTSLGCRRSTAAR